jgi:hypothetical protein
MACSSASRYGGVPAGSASAPITCGPMV